MTMYAKIWLAVSIFAAQNNGPHDWVSDTGSTVRATLVRKETIIVYVLRKEDGTEITVPESRLSANSRALAEMVIASRSPTRAIAKPIPKTPRSLKPGFDPKKVVFEYLRQNVNDTSKLEIVAVGQPIDLAKCFLWTGGEGSEDFRFMDSSLWKPANRPGVAVAVKFRATNAFGALRVQEQVFLISPQGQVITHCDPENVRTSRPAVKKDPSWDEFDMIGGEARRRR